MQITERIAKPLSQSISGTRSEALFMNLGREMSRKRPGHKLVQVELTIAIAEHSLSDPARRLARREGRARVLEANAAPVRRPGVGEEAVRREEPPGLQLLGDARLRYAARRLCRLRAQDPALHRWLGVLLELYTGYGQARGLRRVVAT